MQQQMAKGNIMGKLLHWDAQLGALWKKSLGSLEEGSDARGVRIMCMVDCYYKLVL